MATKASLSRALGVVVIATLPIVTAAVSEAADTEGRRHDPSRPSARGYSQMVYDWTTGHAYLFGGIDEETPSLDYPLHDVWSFNSFTGRWRLRLDSEAFYNAFQRDSVALNPQARKVVLLSTFVNCVWEEPWYCGVETWIYDLRTNTFENVTSGTEPSLRWGSRMVWDAESQRAILFGGSDGYTAETLNDTWAYDFESNTWSPMGPAVSPPPHHFAAMAYHPRADRVVLFGGYDIWLDQVMNDTWAYDYNTNTWTERSPSTSPSPRLYHTLSWDPWSNRMILFGGVAQLYEPVLDDTWAYDLEHNTWTPLAPQGSPSARAWHVTAGTWRGVLLFGGSPTHSPYTLDDSWLYRSHGETWRPIRPRRRH